MLNYLATNTIVVKRVDSMSLWFNSDISGFEKLRIAYLTIYALMDSSIWFDTKTWDGPLSIYRKGHMLLTIFSQQMVKTLIKCLIMQHTVCQSMQCTKG